MNYDICKTVGVEESEETQEFLTQVENNNFNLSYATQQSDVAVQQYASCSNVHNMTMISTACYSNSTAISYTNAVYPTRDCNKNYEEVTI